ncbi:MAG: hypothetical protein KJ622_04035 [Alphaproteobacteria bacterium]|nr:hypothetical protein [Alphaproteobacteria bacterium]
MNKAGATFSCVTIRLDLYNDAYWALDPGRSLGPKSATSTITARDHSSAPRVTDPLSNSREFKKTGLLPMIGHLPTASNLPAPENSKAPHPQCWKPVAQSNPAARLKSLTGLRFGSSSAFMRRREQNPVPEFSRFFKAFFIGVLDLPDAGWRIPARYGGRNGVDL